MSWMKNPKTSFGSQGGLEKAFAKQPQSVGHMPAPPMGLHPATMKPSSKLPKLGGDPRDAGATFGSGPDLPPLPGDKAPQSPGQHSAVVKAGQASAAKRRKGF